MSPRPSTRVEQATTTEIEPALAARLAAILSTRQEYKNDADLYTSLVAEETAKAFELMKEAGIDKATIEGVSCTIVRGYNSKLDKVKFVQLGGSLAQLENATSKKPKKAYLRVGEDKTETETEEAA